MEDFIKGRTTITSRMLETDKLEPPTLTLCFDPPFKTSVARKFGLVQHYDYRIKALPNGTDYGQRFHQLSYILNQDYKVGMSDYDLNNGNRTFINEGTNNVDGLTFEVISIQSLTSGTCLNIQPQFEIKKPFTWTLYIKSTVEDSLDQPNRLMVYLTSKNSWQGISSADWPQFSPSKVEIDFKELGYTYMDSVKATEYQFKEGVDDSDQCWTDGINSGPCPTKCKLFNYVGNSSKLPICKTLEEVKCVLDHAYNFNYWAKCNQKKNVLTFNGDLIRQKRYQDDEWKQLIIGLWQMSKEVKEEILFITTQDMIGSVGGSLGMFFGFSLYTFVIFLIDKSLMHVANRVQAYNTADQA